MFSVGFVQLLIQDGGVSIWVIRHLHGARDVNLMTKPKINAFTRRQNAAIDENEWSPWAIVTPVHARCAMSVRFHRFRNTNRSNDRFNLRLRNHARPQQY